MTMRHTLNWNIHFLTQILLTATALMVFAPNISAQLLPDPIAVLTNCTQSEPLEGVHCSKALNNSYIVGELPSFSECSQTYSHSGTPWWQATIPSTTTTISFVRVYYFGTRVTVKLDNNTCRLAQHTVPGQFARISIFLCNRTGQVIHISDPESEQILAVCTVEVFMEYLTSVHIDHPRFPLQNCSSARADPVQCNNAIDNSTNQDIYGPNTCYNVGTNGWWQAQTQGVRLIKYIRIYTPLVCCIDTPYNITISVDGNTCASYVGTHFKARDFLCNRTGHTLRITSEPNGSELYLCEVQVFGGLESTFTNFGQQLPLISCHQSSVAYDGVCTKAIDNSTEQNCSHCSRTQVERGWWQAKTVKPALITFVRLYLSTDCCFEGLNNITVTVGGKICQPFESGSGSSFVHTVNCNATGRIVKVRNHGVSSLALCEVQVFGDYVTPINHHNASLLQLSNCSQNSVAKRGVCRKALDGKVTRDSSCSQTKKERNKGWWQAKTALRSHITKVIVFYKHGIHSSQHFLVTVNGHRCKPRRAKRKQFSVVTFNCNRTGRVIRVGSVNRKHSKLILCEVLAFGWPIETLPLG